MLAKTRQVAKEQAERADRERVHNARYWVEKFMSSATRQADPELAGHHEETTPLAAVAAARWRRTLSDVQAAEAAATAAAEALRCEAEEEERARSEGAACQMHLLDVGSLCSCNCA